MREPVLVLVYRDEMARGGCHRGLGVTAISVIHCLTEVGIHAEAWGVKDGWEMRERLLKRPDVTHIDIMARWIDTDWMRKFVIEFPRVIIAVTCHSHVGFLQASPWDVKTLGEQMYLQRDQPNFRLTGNSEKYCNWVTRAYNQPCTWLPNLYWIGDGKVTPKVYHGGMLRVGIFGATRLLKNMGSAVAAALVIAADLRVPMEIWVSVGRNEAPGGSLDSCKYMIAQAPDVTLIENPWQPWSEFRETVRCMDINLQPSFTESHNNVACDSISVGIPVVCSPAITWVPKDWKVNPDNPIKIAEAGLRLLKDKKAPRRGLKALETHNKRALKQWKHYLGVEH